jgi:site-specific recombinase XerD
LAEPVAQNGNAEAPVSRATHVLSRLRNTLDLTNQDDLRAGAMLAVLCAGLRKNELVGLDVGDVSEVDGSLALRVRPPRAPNGRAARLVPLSAEAASLLRRYWARERLAQMAPDAPLFWTLGRHGRCRKTRVTGHAVNYWLEQLRRRGGLEGRLTSRSLRQPPRDR